MSTENTPPECRICYSETDNERNPLFSPCNCKGTVKNICVECWIKCERKCVLCGWGTPKAEKNPEVIIPVDAYQTILVLIPLFITVLGFLQIAIIEDEVKRFHGVLLWSLAVLLCCIYFKNGRSEFLSFSLVFAYLATMGIVFIKKIEENMNIPIFS